MDPSSVMEGIYIRIQFEGLIHGNSGNKQPARLQVIYDSGSVGTNSRTGIFCKKGGPAVHDSTHLRLDDSSGNRQKYSLQWVMAREKVTISRITKVSI